MTTAHANRQERAWNIQHMKSSLELLLAASKGWSPTDAARGERTIRQLERQIASAIAESLVA